MLIYDGDCGFCTSTALWAEDRLPEDVPVQPWQALDLDELGLTLDDVSTAAYWVEPSGTLLAGHEAVSGALQAMGRPWALVGRLLGRRPFVWLAAPVYRLIAANRFRLPGATCAIPGLGDTTDDPPPADRPRPDPADR